MRFPYREKSHEDRQDVLNLSQQIRRPWRKAGEEKNMKFIHNLQPH